MWSTRIAEAVRRAGGSAVTLGTAAELAVALEAHELAEEVTLGGAIVDLAGRRFDALVAIERLHASRLPVMAVAQHDDQLTRRRALAAGASRVFSYQKFFSDGPRLVGGWLSASAPVAADESPAT
jgi:DNA-binding NarL/FixJ family response regulator